GLVPGRGPVTWPFETKVSGSKPFRSVKRHGSSVVDGSGNPRYRSSRSVLPIRRISPMEDDRVAVGIGAEGHVADPAVLGARELDAFRLELGACSGDVRDAQRDSADVRRELDPVALGLPERERDLAGGHLALVIRIERQLEGLVIEGARPLRVAGRDRDEVDLLDLHQGEDPSRYGAYRRCS